LKSVEGVESDQMGGNDRIGISDLLSATEDRSFFLIERRVVRVSSVLSERRVLLRSENANESADLASEVGELLREDGVLRLDAGEVETEGFGGARGRFAGGEGGGELRGEGGGFEGETLVFEALFLEERGLHEWNESVSKWEIE
jgi:hypothetical protein